MLNHVRFICLWSNIYSLVHFSRRYCLLRVVQYFLVDVVQYFLVHVVQYFKVELMKLETWVLFYQKKKHRWCFPTLSPSKSSHSLRILAVVDIMVGKSSIRDTVFSVIPWPMEKKACTSITCTPVLTMAFFKYSSDFGTFPEANHFASCKKAFKSLTHCN